MENQTIINISNESKFDNKSYLPLYHKDTEEKVANNSLIICNIQ